MAERVGVERRECDKAGLPRPTTAPSASTYWVSKAYFGQWQTTCALQVRHASVGVCKGKLGAELRE